MNKAAWWSEEILHLRVHLQPRAGRNKVAGLYDDHMKIAITAPPVDGRANAHLIRFLAGEFGVRQAQVSLISGESSRRKHIAIDQPAHIPAWLGIARTSSRL